MPGRHRRPVDERETAQSLAAREVARRHRPGRGPKTAHTYPLQRSQGAAHSSTGAMRQVALSLHKLELSPRRRTSRAWRRKTSCWNRSHILAWKVVMVLGHCSLTATGHDSWTWIRTVTRHRRHRAKRTCSCGCPVGEVRDEKGGLSVRDQPDTVYMRKGVATGRLPNARKNIDGWEDSLYTQYTTHRRRQWCLKRWGGRTRRLGALPFQDATFPASRR